MINDGDFRENRKNQEATISNESEPVPTKAISAGWKVVGGAALVLGLGLSTLHDARVRENKKTPEGEAFKAAALKVGNNLSRALEIQESNPVSEFDADSAAAKARSPVCSPIAETNGGKMCLQPVPLFLKSADDPGYVRKISTADGGYVIEFAVNAREINAQGIVSSAKIEDVKVTCSKVVTSKLSMQ